MRWEKSWSMLLQRAKGFQFVRNVKWIRVCRRVPLLPEFRSAHAAGQLARAHSIETSHTVPGPVSVGGRRPLLHGPSGTAPRPGRVQHPSAS